MLPLLDDLPSSPSSERNKEPILAALREALPAAALVVEVGSRTGQHAAFFAAEQPTWRWQPTDRAHELDGVRARWQRAGLDSFLEPLVFDLTDAATPVPTADAIVAINVIHIAPWAATDLLFAHAARLLNPGGVVFLYGPYRDTRRELEPSNAEFDAWLKRADPEQGLRLFQDVDAVASAHGFALAGEREMPANNRSCWWVKR
jgi:SAM-dependent methyltransferase